MIACTFQKPENVEGDVPSLFPVCLPLAWNTFSITHNHRDTGHHRCARLWLVPCAINATITTIDSIITFDDTRMEIGRGHDRTDPYSFFFCDEESETMLNS